jgi:lexA repressor
MEMSRKIYLLRTENNLTQSEFAKIAGATDKAVSSWEKGTRSPKLQYTKPICEHFGIDLNTFIDEGNDIYKPGFPSNAIPYTVSHKAPIVGSIPAGYPAFAFEDIEGYMDIPYSDEENYFFLRVNGESMKNAGIHTGDLVLIRRQSCAENGQVVAARVNGDEATLKRYKRQGDSVLLLPENPDFEPRIVPVKDFDSGAAQIIGIALEVRHSL